MLLKLNKNVVQRGSEPQRCGSNIHDTAASYFELCRMHTWCRENDIALITYQEIFILGYPGVTHYVTLNSSPSVTQV